MTVPRWIVGCGETADLRIHEVVREREGSQARLALPDGRVVTLLCDRAERYYSTSLFDHPAEPAPTSATS